MTARADLQHFDSAECEGYFNNKTIKSNDKKDYLYNNLILFYIVVYTIYELQSTFK